MVSILAVTGTTKMLVCFKYHNATIMEIMILRMMLIHRAKIKASMRDS